MDSLFQIDFAIFKFINSEATHPWLDWLLPIITDLHKQPAFRFSFLLLGILFYFHKYRKRGLYYFLGCLIALGCTDWFGAKIIKKNFERPRPFQTEGLEVIKRSNAHGYSFHSNHASNMFSFAYYNSYFFPPMKWAFYTMAAIIAYSRVYNGVHFPADVIVGALWGILISFLIIQIIKKIERRFGLIPVETKK